MSVFTNPAAGAEGSAQAYIDATLELLGASDPLTVLRQGPSAFEELIHGRSPEHLRRPEAPGKWSATWPGSTPVTIWSIAARWPASWPDVAFIPSFVEHDVSAPLLGVTGG